MSLLTIYRVEDPMGRGPYRLHKDQTYEQGEVAHELAIRHSDFWRANLDCKDSPTVETFPFIHPGPDDDFGDRWDMMTYTKTAMKYRFGFLTEQRLSAWFMGERDTLDALNMQVAVLQVPHQAVIRGQWQVAYRAASATCVETHPLAGWVE